VHAGVIGGGDIDRLRQDSASRQGESDEQSRLAVKLDVAHDDTGPKAELQFSRGLEVGAKDADAVHARGRALIRHETIDDWH
jgi:hypothetical protein